MADFSLLQKFVFDTVAHLEEIEKNIDLLDHDVRNKVIADDIRKSIRTIRSNLHYAGGELSGIPVEQEFNKICTNLVYSNLSPLPW